MPPAPHPGQDTGELDTRVSALLDQMQQASDRVLKELDGVEASARTALDSAADRMLDQARAAAEAPAPDAPSDIAAVDAELAGAGDALIEGDIADEARALSIAEPPTAPIAPPAPPSVAPTAASAPGPASQPAPAPQPTPAPAPTNAKHSEPPPSQQPGLIRRLVGSAAHAAGRSLLRAAEGVSSIIPAHPPIYRRLMGYLALVTMFNAVCLLGYNFFVRSPEPPKPAATQPTDHDAPPPKPAEGTSKSPDSHGSATPTSAHGEPKKSTTAKKPRTRSALPKKQHGGH